MDCSAWSQRVGQHREFHFTFKVTQLVTLGVDVELSSF